MSARLVNTMKVIVDWPGGGGGGGGGGGWGGWGGGLVDKGA